MTDYFKATRQDATDFRTGTVLYEVGKRVRPKLHEGERYICGPGYLHASDVPTETLIGGSWPCRLFKVEGKPVVGFDSEHPHKGGFRQLLVVEELPAWQVFGPQGEEVAAIIERAGKLTFEEAKTMGAARDAAWDAARDAAWGAARDAAWDAARDAAWDAARDAAWGAAWGAADASLATLTRDLISDKHYRKLMGPWETLG